VTGETTKEVAKQTSNEPRSLPFAAWPAIMVAGLLSGVGVGKKFI